MLRFSVAGSVAITQRHSENWYDYSCGPGKTQVGLGLRKIHKHFHLWDSFGSSNVYTQEKCFWGFEFEPGSLPRWFAVFKKKRRRVKQTNKKQQLSHDVFDACHTYCSLVCEETDRGC